MVKQGRGERLKDKEHPELFSGLIWSGEQAKALGLVDGLGSASYVARDIVGEKNLVDFTVQESPFDRFSKRIGASVAEHLAMWMGFQGQPCVKVERVWGQSAPEFSRNLHAFLKQHIHQPNQWQADQAGRIAAMGALKQAHAQPFRFKAASTVKRLLSPQVALNAPRSSSRIATVNGTQSTWHWPVWLLYSARPVRKVTCCPLAASSCSHARSKVCGLPGSVRPARQPGQSQ